MIYRFIRAEKANHDVKTMCRLLGVSRSAYYAWRSRPPSARQIADADLTRAIVRIHEASRGTYGRPRVQAELRYEGTPCSGKRVARLMRAAGLHGIPSRPRRGLTRRRPGVAPHPRSRGAELHCEGARSVVGGGHLLRTDCRGLALPGDDP